MVCMCVCEEACINYTGIILRITSRQKQKYQHTANFNIIEIRIGIIFIAFCSLIAFFSTKKTIYFSREVTYPNRAIRNASKTVSSQA